MNRAVEWSARSKHSENRLNFFGDNPWGVEEDNTLSPDKVQPHTTRFVVGKEQSELRVRIVKLRSDDIASLSGARSVKDRKV
jgi:hypothetical protein